MGEGSPIYRHLYSSVPTAQAGLTFRPMFLNSSARLVDAGRRGTAAGLGLRGGSATWSGSSRSWRSSSDRNTGHHGAWRAGNPAGLQQREDQADTGTAQDVAGLVHQVLATALLPGLAGGERFAGRAHRLQEVAAVIGRTGWRLVSTRNPDGTIRFLNPGITLEGLSCQVPRGAPRLPVICAAGSTARSPLTSRQTWPRAMPNIPWSPWNRFTCTRSAPRPGGGRARRRRDDHRPDGNRATDAMHNRRKPS
jgi:hypothetical protein